MAAAIVQPYVPAEVHWVVQHHGVFQSYYYAHHLGGDRNARDRFQKAQAAFALAFLATSAGALEEFSPEGSGFEAVLPLSDGRSAHIREDGLAWLSD